MSQEFLDNLQEQTEQDVKTIEELAKQQEQIKQQVNFLQKRIKQANELLSANGRTTV